MRALSRTGDFRGLESVVEDANFPLNRQLETHNADRFHCSFVSNSAPSRRKQKLSAFFVEITQSTNAFQYLLKLFAKYREANGAGLGHEPHPEEISGLD